MKLYSWDIKQMAMKHWEYTEGLLKTTGGITLETCKYLYIQAFVHGAKHFEESTTPKRDRNGKFIK